jgi:hypothetical protein
MKVRIFETVIESVLVDVDVPDGLTGDALEEAIEKVRVECGLDRSFVSCEPCGWEEVRS